MNYGTEFQGECDTPYPYKIGNGECDEELNTEECGYDGGDCVEDQELRVVEILSINTATSVAASFKAGPTLIFLVSTVSALVVIT